MVYYTYKICESRKKFPVSTAFLLLYGFSLYDGLYPLLAISFHLDLLSILALTDAAQSAASPP